MSKKDYSTAYKSYDIRSVYDDPVDNNFAYSLGKGLGIWLKKERGEDACLVFGSDVREANNELIYWFLKGCEDANFHNFVGLGIPVEGKDDQEQARGVTSTAMLYFVTKDEFDVGVMFTASHCPPEYVGLKISDISGQLIPSALLKDMVSSYEEVPELQLEDFERLWTKAMGDANTYFDKIDSKTEKLAQLIGEKYSSLQSSAKIIVDCSSGSAVAYEKAFFEALGEQENLTIEFLCDTADSTYSEHLSDTQVAHDYEMLIDAVISKKADLGIMFDGDADRLGFVDHSGKIVEGDLVGGIIASSILKTYDFEAGEPGIIIHDVFTSKSVVEKIEKLGGEAKKCRVGHTHVKKLLADTGAIFGAEQSGHLFFPEVGGFEFPLFALYYVLAEMEDENLSLAEVAKPYQCYHKSPMTKLHLEQKQQALDKIKKHYQEKGYNIDETDGVGVYGDDFWFVLRSSNTEPIMKLVVEADSEERKNELLAEVQKLTESCV